MKYHIIKELEKPQKKSLFVVLDSIQDPQNVGSIIRTCSYMGVDGVVCSDGGIQEFSPIVSKGSSGALETYNKIYFTRNLAKFIANSKQNGWKVCGAGQGPREHKSFVDPLILVLGNEQKGIRKQVNDQLDEHLWIPCSSPEYLVDSLNVGVALGILTSKIMGKN